MAKKKVTPIGVKVRRTWGALRPTTRVKQSKKLYRRKESQRDYAADYALARAADQQRAYYLEHPDSR